METSISRLKILDKWIAIHSNLIDKMNPYDYGYNRESIQDLWKKFSFRKFSFQNDSPFMNLFLHWFFLEYRSTGMKKSIAQYFLASDYRSKMHEDEKNLLSKLIKLSWSYYKIIKIDHKNFTYIAQDIFNGKKWEVIGRNASKVYQKDMVLFTIIIPIEGINFTVASNPSVLKTCVIPAIKNLKLEKFPNKEEYSLRDEREFLRKLAFDFVNIGGFLGFKNVSDPNVRYIQNLDDAIEGIIKASKSIGFYINKKQAVELGVDIIIEKFLKGPDAMTFNGLTLTELAKNKCNHSLINEFITTFSEHEINHGLKSQVKRRLTEKIYGLESKNESRHY